VAPGGSVKVDITYNGVPQQGGFGYFVFGTRSGKPFAWSLSEPYGAREWWPCKDHPSDKADSVRVTCTVPAVNRVGSNGLLVSETTVGPNKIYDWVTHYPISNYLVSVAISDYARTVYTYNRPAPLAALYGALSMPIDNLMYNDGSAGLPTGWGQAGDMISVFEEWYGPYGFANEKYGHSECTFGGGMEHQTMTSLNGSSISLVSHELGHQWYGDKVTTKTWQHLWLNEGFATYSALLYFQQRSNLYPGMYESQFTSTYNSALTASGTIVLQDTTDVANMFASSRVYNKGGMVLHMIRSIVGDSVFKNIMKSYATDPALQYNCARTSDFKRVVETVTGSDWDTFFSQWVETGTGYPSYTKCSLWVPTGNGDWRVQVTLHQIQVAPTSNVNVFVMPVPIVIHTTGGDVNQVVMNDQRDQTFVFFVPNQPTSVEVDPSMHILRADPIPNGACDPVGTGAGPLALRSDIVSVYPNPATGSFQVQYVAGDAGKIELGVYDVAGRRVLSRTVSQAAAGPGAELFNASKLPAGVYFVRMRAAHGELITRKLVVIR
jgi:aminopeptidase N